VIIGCSIFFALTCESSETVVLDTGRPTYGLL